MSDGKIKDIFSRDIHRDIREVIKVDQTDEDVIRDEIGEYIVTKTILENFVEVLEAYSVCHNKPSDRMAVWVSGFFGSGKSSFAKLLGLAIANRPLGSDTTSDLLAQHVGDDKLKVLIQTITEKIPTEAVIFDVATETGVMSGNQMLTEIMYRQLLEHLNYARDFDLAELEITLEGKGRLDDFLKVYHRVFPDKDWDTDKNLTAFAMNDASRVMHEMDPATFSSPDSWVKGAMERKDISPNMLAERCKELAKRRGEDRNLVFVIDEVGQFVARTVNKMLDLQGIVQALGRVGQGKYWVVVTSQERLNELVGSLDDSRVELARLMDRFPLQVHLEPSDISEVTSKRVLAKTSAAEQQLTQLYEANRGSLAANASLSADITLPQLARENFVELYPMMPYQVDFVIHVVSGLRTQGGAGHHVGGANRTVIKLAQQLLAHPSSGLGEHDVGALVTTEHIYDLVRGNIDSSIREKIDNLPGEVEHPFAQRVAKTICLLQFVQSIHRNAENIAAALYPTVGGDSVRASVDQALQALEDAHKIRRGEDGYRIPTPTEDDWETQRAALNPNRAASNQILRKTIEDLWKPQPSFTLENIRPFKASLWLDGRERIKGDVQFQIRLAEDPDDYDRLRDEARRQSQNETETICWVILIDDRIDKQVSDVFRSKEMITTREHTAQTSAENKLLSEEGRRRDQHQAEVRRLLEQAALASVIYFRGNDRSPGENDTSVAKAAETVLGTALPDIFDRFSDGAARVQKNDLKAMLEGEDLRGLPSVYTELGLLASENGTPIINVESDAISDILSIITNSSEYGTPSQGKSLVSHFGGSPYGWDVDVVKLLTLCLFRSGQIMITSQGQSFESVGDLGASEVFNNNTKFRAATFRPKEVLDFAAIAKAAEAFKNTFGEEIVSIEQGEVARAIREKATDRQAELRDVLTTLERHGLPGSELFASAGSQMESLPRAAEEEVILGFASSHAELKDALSRAADIQQAMTEPKLAMLDRAKQVLESQWPFLADEPDTGDEDRECADQLTDLMQKETFYKELPTIDQQTTRLNQLYRGIFDAAVTARSDSYSSALEKLTAIPGWAELPEDVQQRISQPLANCTSSEVPDTTPIPQLRADTDACSKRLEDAIAKVHQLIEGDRVVPVKITDHFSGGVIDTEEQLDSALGGLRDECLSHIGKNKGVLIQ
ncbi:MAG TPA: BREX system P-loop protein BrxC [Planctomycetaceae bacterium]|nr:BREX system P-loop protein BrxC [Planctomycetaceae bacterium]